MADPDSLQPGDWLLPPVGAPAVPSRMEVVEVRPQERIVIVLRENWRTPFPLSFDNILPLRPYPAHPVAWTPGWVRPGRSIKRRGLDEACLIRVVRGASVSFSDAEGLFRIQVTDTFLQDYEPVPPFDQWEVLGWLEV